MCEAEVEALSLGWHVYEVHAPRPDPVTLDHVPFFMPVAPEADPVLQWVWAEVRHNDGWITTFHVDHAPANAMVSVRPASSAPYLCARCGGEVTDIADPGHLEIVDRVERSREAWASKP